jgi:hypothetical protein
MVANVLEADHLGLPIDEYIEARALGCDHDEIVTVLLRYGIHVGDYADARRAGVTYDQLIAYMAVTTERLSAQHPRYLTGSIRAGATMDQVMAAARAGHSIASYEALISRTVSHQTATEFLSHTSARYTVACFCELYDDGIPPKEAFEVLTQTLRTTQYIAKRNQGLSHRAALRNINAHI